MYRAIAILWSESWRIWWVLKAIDWRQRSSQRLQVRGRWSKIHSEVYCVFGDIAALSMIVAYASRGLPGLLDSRELIFHFLSNSEDENYVDPLFFIEWLMSSPRISWWKRSTQLACHCSTITLCSNSFSIVRLSALRTHTNRTNSSQKQLCRTGSFRRKCFAKKSSFRCVIVPVPFSSSRFQLASSRVFQRVREGNEELVYSSTEQTSRNHGIFVHLPEYADSTAEKGISHHGSQSNHTAPRYILHPM